MNKSKSKDIDKFERMLDKITNSNPEKVLKIKKAKIVVRNLKRKLKVKKIKHAEIKKNHIVNTKSHVKEIHKIASVNKKIEVHKKKERNIVKPLEKHPEMLDHKETLHTLVTLPNSTGNGTITEDNETEKKDAEKSLEKIKEIEQSEDNDNKNSFSKAVHNLLVSSSKNKNAISTKEEIKKNETLKPIASTTTAEEEEQTSQVTVTPEKFKGDEIDAYTIKIDGASADIKIIKSEIGTNYSLNIPKISVATTALLNDLREELIAITSVSMQELIDPKAFASIKKRFKDEAAKLIRKKIPTIRDETESFLVGTLMQEMLGIGKIEYLINDPNLEEIVIVSAKEPIKVYSKKYGWLSTNITLEKEEVTINYSNIIARRVGRQITVLNPLLDAHLVTGDRVNAVLYPINTKGNTIVIRKFARDPYTIIDLINNKTCDLETAALLWLAVEYEMNVIISGGTASGKTVLLNACMPFVPPNQRIISIEDTKELMLPDFLYWTPLVTRLPNAEGKGAVSMLDLLINSLRMRPDRIILGEMRKHEEAMVLFEAMHTGHSVYATLHADSAAETISRLTHPPLNIPGNLLKAINLNVVMFRDRRRGIRRILQIAEIETEGDMAKANTLYRWSPDSDKLVKHSKSSKFFEDISRHTSMSEEEINKELNLKKKILTWLISHNVRKLGDLGKAINLYYQNKELLLKKMYKDDIKFILNYGQ